MVKRPKKYARPRECAYRRCADRFVPRVASQKYCTDDCRLAEQRLRYDETKAERALRHAERQKHQQFLPSSFFDGSRIVQVITDIRFEINADKNGRAGSREIVAARLRGVSQASKAGDDDALYGEIVRACAALAAWATRLKGGARFRQKRTLPSAE